MTNDTGHLFNIPTNRMCSESVRACDAVQKPNGFYLGLQNVAIPAINVAGYYWPIIGM